MAIKVKIILILQVVLIEGGFMTLALITGATSGIGKETAIALAQNGIDLIICGRRTQRLIELKSELSSMVNIYTLSFDISIKEEIDKAINSLPLALQQIDILINNAGNAHGLETIENADFSDWELMIDINLKGLMYLTKKVIPSMCQRKCGQIINVGSIAGKEVYSRGNGYCATKFAVDAFTKAIRLDLLKYNIKVSAINPGLVDTEFSKVRFKRDKEKADAVYRGFTPLYGQDIAQAILFMITRPVHVNIADMLILPTAQGSAAALHKESTV